MLCFCGYLRLDCCDYEREAIKMPLGSRPRLWNLQMWQPREFLFLTVKICYHRIFLNRHYHKQPHGKKKVDSNDRTSGQVRWGSGSMCSTFYFNYENGAVNVPYCKFMSRELEKELKGYLTVGLTEMVWGSTGRWPYPHWHGAYPWIRAPTLSS